MSRSTCRWDRIWLTFFYQLTIYSVLDVTIDVQLGIITTRTHIVSATPLMPQFNKSFWANYSLQHVFRDLHPLLMIAAHLIWWFYKCTLHFPLPWILSLHYHYYCSRLTESQSSILFLFMLLMTCRLSPVTQTWKDKCLWWCPIFNHHSCFFTGKITI